MEPFSDLARLRRRVSTDEPSPGLRMTFIESPYLIAGSTVAQWLESMDLLGPWRDGARRSAHTDWRLSWSYVPAPCAAGFTVGGARVRLTVETTLPTWLPPPGVSPETLERWRDIAARLERHERGHIEIGVAAARAVSPPSVS